MMTTLLKTDVLKANILMLLGLIVGIWLFTFDIIGFRFIFFPGDLGDGRLNLYFLEHAHKFFTGEISSFWDANFMYPVNNVIAYSDNLLGSAPIYSLFRLIGFDIYMSYQLWFIVLSSMNYIFAFYFLKYVFKNNYSAVLGAFIFAFSLALHSQLTHAQTFPRFSIPLAFLMAVKFDKEFKPKYFFFTLLFVVYQIYCGIYLGFMLAVPIGIYLGIIITKAVFFDNRTIFNLKWLLYISVYFLFNALILLPLMLPYMERKILPSFEHYEEIFNSIPTIKSHLFSQQGSLLWDFLSKIGRDYEAWWDHQIFAGGVATICLVIGVLGLLFHCFKSRFRMSALSGPLMLILVGLITSLLYLRFESISAYIALYFLPGFSSMRSLTRIINIELIFFAIATAFVFSKIFEKKLKYKEMVFMVCLALIVFDNYFYTNESYRTKVSVAKERTCNIEKVYSELPTGSITSYEPIELNSPSIYYQIDAMLVSQKYNLKSLNGYTARSPRDYNMWNDLNEESRNYWLSNKNIEQDTIYIIKSHDIVEKVSVNEIEEFALKTAPKMKLEKLINYISSNKEWMKEIRKKAMEKNVSIDSMIILDAKWVMENEK